MEVVASDAQGLASPLTVIEYPELQERLRGYLATKTTDDEVLANTPRRIVGAWEEMLSGYGEDPYSIMETAMFPSPGDNMVVINDIPVISVCEHHVLPFTGTAHVAYIPNGVVVGLSKIPRVVEAFARRLQLQERLTQQIADCIEESFPDEHRPLGVGVMIEARHACMTLRGARAHSADFTTSALLGYMMDRQDARDEFLRLAGK